MTINIKIKESKGSLKEEMRVKPMHKWFRLGSPRWHRWFCPGIAVVVGKVLLSARFMDFRLRSVPACRDARRAETNTRYFGFNKLDIYAHASFYNKFGGDVCSKYSLIYHIFSIRKIL